MYGHSSFLPSPHLLVRWYPVPNWNHQAISEVVAATILGVSGLAVSSMLPPPRKSFLLRHIHSVGPPFLELALRLILWLPVDIRLRMILSGGPSHRVDNLQLLIFPCSTPQSGHQPAHRDYRFHRFHLRLWCDHRPFRCHSEGDLLSICQGDVHLS